MLSLFTHLITESNGLIVLFIPATYMDDTKTIFDSQATNLLMDYICSLVENMCHTSHVRNNSFIKVTMIQITDYLNYITIHL
jgi:hypothetical protein